MIELPGRPSDTVAPILATGRSGVSTLFLSLSARHSGGEDAGYLAWHTLDHRPEQFRLEQVRAAIRVVSTPECRNARAVSSPELDAVDHVMAYFFTDDSGMPGFADLAVALKDAGRMAFSLPSVMAGTFAIGETIGAPHVKAGADVLPWWPATGVYLVVSQGAVPLAEVMAVEGVAGIWTASATRIMTDAGLVPADSSQHVTYCFLEGDPVLVGERLRPVIAGWQDEAGEMISLAAPFYMIVPREWDHHLP